MFFLKLFEPFRNKSCSLAIKVSVLIKCCRLCLGLAIAKQKFCVIMKAFQQLSRTIMVITVSDIFKHKYLYLFRSLFREIPFMSSMPSLWDHSKLYPREKACSRQVTCTLWFRSLTTWTCSNFISTFHKLIKTSLTIETEIPGDLEGPEFS